MTSKLPFQIFNKEDTLTNKIDLKQNQSEDLKRKKTEGPPV